MPEQLLPPLPDTPVVNVVIPCRNERGHIGACLQSLVDADRSGLAVVVHVCDGRSEDGTRDVVNELAARHPFIRCVDNPMRTTPYALNLGLKAATFDVGIILGAHAMVDKAFLAASVAALRGDLSVGCAGGLIDNVYSDRVSRLIGAAMSHPFGVGNAHFRTGRGRGYVDTVAFGAYRREVFDHVGWFDEELARNQDDEFNHRVLQGGFKVLLDPAIRSSYVVRASFGKLWRQYAQYGMWKVYVNRKHRMVTTARQLVPAAWVAWVALGLVAGILWRPALWAWACGLLAYGAAAWWSAARIAAKGEVAGVMRAFMVLHASYGLGYWRGILLFLLLRRRPGERASALTR